MSPASRRTSDESTRTEQRPATCAAESGDFRTDDGGPRHVVLGTGQLGLAIARVLRTRDVAVSIRLVNRRGSLDDAVSIDGLDDEGVEVVAADLTDPAAAARACAGASVVYFTAKPPYTEWPERFPPLLEGALAGAAEADAVFVYADNCYMYGPAEGPITESHPHRATTRKGRTRAALAERVLAAHADGELRTTICRASDFYGPDVTESQLGERVFDPLLDGTKASVVGDPDCTHTYTYIEDFAHALVTLGEHDAALGDVWHVPNQPTISTREFVESVGRVAGTDASVRGLPSWLFRVLSWFDGSLRELREMSYLFEEPFVLDDEAFRGTFDLEPTPREVAIERTLAWYRAR